MLRSIGLCIGFFLGCILSGFAIAEDFNPDNYTIYYGDLNADGASDMNICDQVIQLKKGRVPIVRCFSAVWNRIF